MSLTEIGVITKPQGLKGHFRVRLTYSNFSVSELSTVVIKNQNYNIEKITDRKSFYVFKLSELNHINDVEILRGEKVFAKLTEQELKEDEYFASDLIGLDVFDGEKKLGVVKNILQFGAADVFEVIGESGVADFMFPFARGVITKVDKANKIIHVDKSILEEIST